MKSDIRYPNIEVQLSGQNGNAFYIIGSVTRALRESKVENDEIDAFVAEATSGDYNHLLRTCMTWVKVR